MKGRAFTAVVLSLLLLLSGLGIGGWWLLWQRGPLRLAHQRLEMPRAARFVPASAALSLYLFSDAEQPVAYARAVAPTRQRRRAAEAIARLRDGAFAAAGLDYDSELAGWLGSDIAVALFDDPVAAATGTSAEQPASGWLLALASRDDDGARRFLQRFWQTRSLAGTDLQVSRYRGMGMISGRGALLGSQPVPLATALVDDDLVLIASGRNLLERALDVSQIASLNQTGLPQLQPGLEAFERGAALLLAAPSALQNWLGLPPVEAPEDPAAPPPFLMAVLRPEGRDLVLRSRLSLPAGSVLSPLDSERAAALLAAVPGSPASLALLEDPAALQADPLLRPLLQRALGRLPQERAERQGPLPELLVRSISGALLAAQGPAGWWMGSEAEAPDPAVLQPLAEQAGLLQAPLDVEGRPLQVWTHLELPLRSGGRGGRRGAAQAGAAQSLQATLAGWREQREGLAWWAGNLEQVPAAAGGADLERLRRRLQQLERPLAALQWSLDADGARALLRSWQPWRLLSALAGGGLDSPVRGLALAVSSEVAAAPSRPAEAERQAGRSGPPALGRPMAGGAESDSEGAAAGRVQAGDAVASQSPQPLPPRQAEAAAERATAAAEAPAAVVAEPEPAAPATAEAGTADQSAVAEPALPAATVDAGTAESATAETAMPDAATVEAAPPDAATADPASVEPATADAATADGATASPGTADEDTADQATAGDDDSDQAIADQARVDPAALEEAAADAAMADPAMVDSSTADAATLGEPAAEAVTPDQAAEDEDEGKELERREVVEQEVEEEAPAREAAGESPEAAPFGAAGSGAAAVVAALADTSGVAPARGGEFRLAEVRVGGASRDGATRLAALNRPSAAGFRQEIPAAERSLSPKPPSVAIPRPATADDQAPPAGTALPQQPVAPPVVLEFIARLDLGG